MSHSGVCGVQFFKVKDYLGFSISTQTDERQKTRQGKRSEVKLGEAVQLAAMRLCFALLFVDFQGEKTQN